MAIQSATYANTQTTSVLTGLTYVDTLISGATAKGKNHIFLEGNEFNSSYITGITAAGYKVTTKYHDMGTYPVYKITW
jgi:hypothetical protein